MDTLSRRMHRMELGKARHIVRAYLLSIGIWCTLYLLTGWQYLNFDRVMNHASPVSNMILYAQAGGLSYALLTPPIFYIVLKYSSDTRHLARYFMSFGLGVAPFMVLYTCIHWVVLPPWDHAQQRYVSRWTRGPFELMYTDFADQILTYIAIVTAAHAYAYLKRVRIQELEKYEYQQALAATEMQVLKVQLQPHFLFNTLHGISTLIDNDQANAKAMVIKLSSLLRTALQHRGADLIPLQEELQFLEEYLDLERMRFGARLSTRWLVSPDTREMLVPQMILQPLVENAVHHGITNSREGGWVEISSHRSTERLELCIRNSVGSNQNTGSGLGIPNTEARLKYMYGGEASFSFVLGNDRTATATLLLPALGSNPAPVTTLRSGAGYSTT